MNLKKFFIILPLVGASLTTSAEVLTDVNQATMFQFSAEASRTVEKDLMDVSLYSRKSGKSLVNLKNDVSVNLNKVLAAVKQYPEIEVKADGIKNFLSIEKVLEGLSNQVAINDIRFSVSPETMKVLEDELTLEVIKRFKYKAEVVQKSLNAKGYQLVDVQLNTLNSEGTYGVRPMMAMDKSANYSEEMPLEAGKEIISATASGKVKFE